MSVNEPVQFKIFVVVSAGVDKLLGNLQQPHVEEELNAPHHIPVLASRVVDAEHPGALVEYRPGSLKT